MLIFLTVISPLIFYVNVIPAFISEHLRMPPPLAFAICVWLLLVSSCVLCQVLMLRRRHHKELAIYFPLTLTLPLFSCCLCGDFGQREHLFLILYFPFFLARWLRWSGNSLSNWEAGLAGVLAGIGLCFKPYFFIPAVLCELYWLSEKRKFRAFASKRVLFRRFSCGPLRNSFLFLTYSRETVIFWLCRAYVLLRLFFLEHNYHRHACPRQLGEIFSVRFCCSHCGECICGSKAL